MRRAENREVHRKEVACARFGDVLVVDVTAGEKSELVQIRTE